MRCTLLQHHNKFYSALLVFSVCSTLLLLFYLCYGEKHFPSIFSYFENAPKTKSVVRICQKHPTLREYCMSILKCEDKDVIDISTDVSILHEMVFNSIQHQNFSHRKYAYLQSDAFLKFKAFHQSTKFALSVHSLNDFIHVIRIPVLATLESPNNDSRYLYVFPFPVVHRTQRTISPFQSFGDGTYSVGKATPFEAVFLMVTDAIAHSSNGNVVVQTCSRAITVGGCSISNVNIRLQSRFPWNKNTFMCSGNLTSSHATIISVNKLVVLAHTWYSAFYHLSIEAMSRLMILHELVLFDPEIYVLLEYPIYRRSAKQLFDLFGIAKNRIIYYHSGMEDSTLFRANTMFIPRGISCGVAPASLLEQISVKALNPAKIGTLPPKPYLSLPLPSIRLEDENKSISIQPSFRVKTGPIILISRRNVYVRSIQNEMDVINFLTTEYGMIPLVMFYGNMSVIDSIALFHSARVVVAPHGAAQVHILWMRPGTAMVEISSPSGYNSCFQTIATYRQIHTAIYFDVTARTGSVYRIDMPIFMQLFEELMQGRY